MYELAYTLTYLKIYKKYIQKDQKLLKALNKTLELMMQNPFYSSLNTHKVDTKRNKDIYSSRITGDWRIGWVFDEKAKKAIIICLEVGTHSEASQIYAKAS
jgi:mRNA-degrading endonuclease YafQ of YafQ-DinJ toxin-antitoxin module